MNNYVSVYVIVEGQTEQTFVRELLAPELGAKGVFIEPILIGKNGHKGGNVHYRRAMTDVPFLLKRPNTYLTTFLDYYKIDSQWPGLKTTGSVEQIIIALKEGTRKKVQQDFPIMDIDKRFIPYFAVHEFEALLFSDPEILATKLDCPSIGVNQILTECGQPEYINNGPHTAPSKRLNALSPFGKFKKTTTGIAIAREIGLDTMRKRCPHFDLWLKELEALT